MSLIILDGGGASGTVFNVSINDTVSVTDGASVDLTGVFEFSLSDSTSVSDVTETTATYSRPGTDTTTVADAVGGVVIFGVDASDSIAVADQLLIEASYVRIGSDSSVVSDTVVGSTITGILFLKTIADTIAVTDVVFVPAEYPIIIFDTITVTDTVSGVTPAPPVPVFISGHPKNPNGLELAILKITNNHPPSPLLAAQLYTTAYEAFAITMIPTPILAGRRIMFQNSIMPMLIGAGPYIKAVNAIIQGFTNYWMGMPVAGGGTVTSFVGVPTMAAGLNQVLSNTSNTNAVTARKLAKVLTDATHLVFYTIPGFPPLPLI